MDCGRLSAFGVQGHDGVEGGIALLDRRQEMAEQLPAGHRPVPDSPGKFGGRGVIEIHARTVSVFTLLLPARARLLARPPLTPMTIGTAGPFTAGWGQWAAHRGW